MRRITLALDEELLKHSRRYAQERGMSLDSLVGQLLIRAVLPAGGRRCQELFRLMDGAGGNSHGKKWTRDELHEEDSRQGRSPGT